jgi:hypothetical protein
MGFVMMPQTLKIANLMEVTVVWMKLSKTIVFCACAISYKPDI